jgi:hypothetical protein
VRRSVWLSRLAGFALVLRSGAATAQEAHEPHTNVYPEMHLSGFSDVDLRASDEPGKKTTFALGQITAFVTSRISEDISALAEIVVEANDQNHFEVDAERLLVELKASDYLAVAAGRYHTAIGYYNTAYHHSAWMQTAADRPFLFRFEDDGGPLPVHNVGISAHGVVPVRPLSLTWILQVGNGRTSRTTTDEPVQNVVDENNGKAVNAALVWRSPSVPGLEAGISAYHDRLEPEGLPATTQTIVDVHGVYRSSGIELLAEALWIRHAPRGEEVLNIPAGYVQASYQLGAFRPYLRGETINVAPRDPVLSDVGRRSGLTAGLRYDLAEYAAFKLQVDRVLRRSRETTDAITAQIAFAF